MQHINRNSVLRLQFDPQYNDSTPAAICDGQYLWVGQLLPWALPERRVPSGIRPQAKQLWQNLQQLLRQVQPAQLLQVTVTVADERLLSAAQGLFCDLAGAAGPVFCWRIGRFGGALLSLDAVAKLDQQKEEEERLDQRSFADAR